MSDSSVYGWTYLDRVSGPRESPVNSESIAENNEPHHKHSAGVSFSEMGENMNMIERYTYTVNYLGRYFVTPTPSREWVKSPGLPLN